MAVRANNLTLDLGEYVRMFTPLSSDWFCFLEHFDREVLHDVLDLCLGVQHIRRFKIVAEIL